VWCGVKWSGGGGVRGRERASRGEEREKERKCRLHFVIFDRIGLCGVMILARNKHVWYDYSEEARRWSKVQRPKKGVTKGSPQDVCRRSLN